MSASVVVAALAGLLVGGVLGALAAGLLAAQRGAAERSRLAAEAARAQGRREEQDRLGELFEVASARALDRSAEQLAALADARLREAATGATAELEARRVAVEHLVTPLREALARVETVVTAAERARGEAHAAMVREVELMRQSSEALRGQTAALVTALRRPHVRGRWGELQLRRAVELAGMAARCDFDEQVSVSTDDGPQRPDLVVRMPGGRNVAVDAKVSLSAFLEAAEAVEDEVRAERIAAHARHLREHVDGLAAKRYWAAFQAAPEFVVLFVPGEAFLAPALEVDPGLLEYALNRKVHIATPTSLVSLLRTVAYGWQQTAVTENARAVFDVGRDLYRRLSAYAEHVEKLGRSLGSAVRHYNAAIGSLERNVLSQARRLNQLGVTTEELPEPTGVSETIRAIAAAELLTPRDGAVVALDPADGTGAAAADGAAAARVGGAA